MHFLVNASKDLEAVEEHLSQVQELHPLTQAPNSTGFSQEGILKGVVKSRKVCFMLICFKVVHSTIGNYHNSNWNYLHVSKCIYIHSESIKHKKKT